VKRGIFFANGSEWTRMRQPLNRILLKNGPGLKLAAEASKLAANEAVNSLLSQMRDNEGFTEIEGLDKILQSWSLDNVLRSLLGPSVDAGSWDHPKLVKSVADFFQVIILKQKQKQLFIYREGHDSYFCIPKY